MIDWIFIYFIATLIPEFLILSYVLDPINMVVEFPSPSFSYVYKHTKMNWFGCLIVAIIYQLLCPIFTIIYFIYWLFHVGRRNDEEDKDVPVI